MPPPARPLEPSPTTGRARGITGAPLHLTFATLDRRLFRSISERNNDGVPGKVRRYRPNKFLWGTVLSAAFVSVGCIFGQPLRVESVFASVATAYKQALEMKSGELQETEDAAKQNSAAVAQAAASRRNGLGRSLTSRPRSAAIPLEVPPDQTPPSAETLQADASLDQDRFAGPTSRVLIPESLRIPQPEAATVRTVSVKRSPSLLSQLEPVSLPEDLSQGLLLQKVPPSYPEQALKAGLQGAVVLQAWIGRDGNIRDLKLIDGSFLLGQAAVKAVKQWRYKPYLRNGVAVEAETYVTVDFRLP
jgi:TonB family protein